MLYGIICVVYHTTSVCRSATLGKRTAGVVNDWFVRIVWRVTFPGGGGGSVGPARCWNAYLLTNTMLIVNVENGKDFYCSFTFGPRQQYDSDYLGRNRLKPFGCNYDVQSIHDENNPHNSSIIPISIKMLYSTYYFIFYRHTDTQTQIHRHRHIITILKI